MSVQVGADDLVEDARVHDDTHHREHRGGGRGDRGADRAGDVTIDHEHRCEGIDRRDGPEDDERRARHAPEPLSIGAQRRAEDFPDAGRPRTTSGLYGSVTSRSLARRSRSLAQRIVRAGSDVTRRWSRSADGTRFELEVQAADTAQDVRRHVVVAAGAGGAVLLLGDPDVVHPVEQSLDGDASLGARERGAGTRVGAVAEREVLARVGALDVEVGGMVEAARDRGSRRR